MPYLVVFIFLCVVYFAFMLWLGKQLLVFGDFMHTDYSHHRDLNRVLLRIGLGGGRQRRS